MSGNTFYAATLGQISGGPLRTRCKSRVVGLSHAPASGASLLLNLEGVFTASIAWVVFRENVDRRILLGMAAIVAGGVLLPWQGRLAGGGLLGPPTIAAACACWAIDNNLTQKVSAGDPVQVAMLIGAVAGSVNVGLALALGATWPSVVSMSAALLLGFASYGGSLVFFREPVTVGLIGGAMLMGVGVLLHLTERHDHEHAHETLVHEHSHAHDEHHQHAHDVGDPPGDLNHTCIGTSRWCTGTRTIRTSITDTHIPG